MGDFGGGKWLMTSGGCGVSGFGGCSIMRPWECNMTAEGFAMFNAQCSVVNALNIGH
jgi:hypothetical protein